MSYLVGHPRSAGWFIAILSANLLFEPVGIAPAQEKSNPARSNMQQPKSIRTGRNAKVPVPGTTLVETYQWGEEHAAGRLKEFELEKRPNKNPSEALVIRRDEADASPIALLTIENPDVKRPGYTMYGKIRYEGVEGNGYFEMWNHFPDGSASFSRTLADIGSMSKISGESGWREVIVPFFLEPPPGQKIELNSPSKLELNLVLPGKGTVWIGPLQLLQLKATATGGAAGLSAEKQSTWWSPQTGNWIGALIGTALGLSGAAMGLLRGLGRGGRIIFAITIVWILLGVNLSLLGVVAWFAGQPFQVYFPVLLTGLLASAIMGGLAPTLSHASRERELRRMQALDIA